MKDVSLHILDIVQNSIDAGATYIFITIHVTDHSKITISDNGSGMDAKSQAQAMVPGYTTRANGRGGMGLFLLNEAAENTELISTPGVGTIVSASFPSGFPLGEIDKTNQVLLHCNPHLTFVIRCETEDSIKILDTRNFKRNVELN